ncbi:uncharacterized protein LOC129590009 [Paramacrobiotus metropolitanus]|uniref:uncharacterized protein LOC129590009 n=1 Tax=Paramacrobiotus metropolitanus TaxID=2943436 RepID=UPI00244582E3|nr:uncharacterized protein LOC129590009 [Paramacrobiotus metropolitanus]
MVGSKLDDHSGSLCEAIASMLTLVSQGKIPADIRPIFFGGKLLALRKKDGGLRPIAVGLSLRRLIAKIIFNRIADRATALLTPHQSGFNVRGGAEAIVHATRHFILSKPEDIKALVKIDFRNAFNTVSREIILDAVHTHFPEYDEFFWSAYGYHSSLFIDQTVLSSECGVQQGDPLGPLLFCLALLRVIATLSTELNAWYLDDGTLGGAPAAVAENFTRVIEGARTIGLDIYESKCELFVSGGSESERQEVIESFVSHHPQLRVISNSTLTLLGAPVLDDAISDVLDEKSCAINRACERLQLLPRHHALYLLRHCLGAPKIIYVLRSCNAWKHPHQLYQIDESLRSCFQELSNVRGNHDDYPCWRQATLPVSRGGIGIRRAEELSLPAFLASIHSAFDLLSSMLPQHPAVDASEAIELWKVKARQPEMPEVAFRKLQKTWDLPLCNVSVSVLMELFRNDGVNTARLLAQSRPEAGIWLNALPSAHIGNLLDDETMKISIGLRLGADICEPHNCTKCHKLVDKLGHHGLSCSYSAGRHARHGGLNNIVCRACVSAGIPAKLEPRGTSSTTDQRPDGCTTFAWKRGMCLAWDVTCVDTMALSHRPSTSVTAGRYIFSPIAFETMGPWGPSAIAIVKELGKRLQQHTGERRSHEFLRQRLSLEIQRGNAASILGTMDGVDSLNEVLLLGIISRFCFSST